MLRVTGASVRGLRNAGGLAAAEVEVHAEGAPTAELLAYFREGPHGYQLVRVMSIDARTDVDWYDNDLHQAFADVTMTLFDGPSHAAGNDRKQFAAEVLGMPGVLEALNRYFGHAGS